MEIRDVLHVAESYNTVGSERFNLVEVASRIGDEGDAAEDEELSWQKDCARADMSIDLDSHGSAAIT